MSISPEYLPSELHYIIPLAERHGSNARVAKFDRRLDRHVEYAETLSPDDIEPLRQLHAEISAKGHRPVIIDWHNGQRGEGTCPRETTWPVYGLLCLFDQLGRLGVPPFSDDCHEEEQTEETLDWSKLPSSLRYLAAPAETYGRLQFDDPIDEFLQERMTDEQLAELRVLNRRIDEDEKAICRWLDEFRMTEHPEARLVYFTGHLLGRAADLDLL